MNITYCIYTLNRAGKLKFLKTMKFFFLLVLFFSLTMNLRSQTFSENFIGDHFQLYKGVFFIVNENAQWGFTKSFYNDLKYCQIENDKNVLYPDKRISGKTDIDSLKNRVFIVLDIIDKDSNSITDPKFSESIFLVLKDTLNQQTFYFKYDKYFENGFPFLTSKIAYDDNLYCSKIITHFDDFTNEITYNSPLIIKDKLSPIIIYKIKRKGQFIYYLSLTTESSSVVVDGTGAIILFTDGTKLTKPCKIDVDVNKTMFRYSAFITLSQADLNTLSTKLIKKYRLYIFDEVLNQEVATQFRAYVKCIKTKK